MKAHEKGNGNAPKPTSSDAKETASVKSEQVRFSCSLVAFFFNVSSIFIAFYEGCMKHVLYVYLVFQSH